MTNLSACIPNIFIVLFYAAVFVFETAFSMGGAGGLSERSL
jgi:ABC-type microcin C transport system permease subunit YejB